MAELLSTFMTPGVKAMLIVLLLIIIVLYIMSIVWVVRDAYLRGTSPVVWGIIAVIPFVGAMIYAMLRPPLYASDQEEQNIGMLLQQRQLMAYGECPQCGYPTERDYVICPNCHMHLKKTCSSCGRTMEPEWTVCPYCATPAEGNGAPAQNRLSHGTSAKPHAAGAAKQGAAAKGASGRASSSAGRASRGIGGRIGGSKAAADKAAADKTAVAADKAAVAADKDVKPKATASAAEKAADAPVSAQIPKTEAPGTSAKAAAAAAAEAAKDAPRPAARRSSSSSRTTRTTRTTEGTSNGAPKDGNA